MAEEQKLMEGMFLKQDWVKNEMKTEYSCLIVMPLDILHDYLLLAVRNTF